MRFGNVWLLVAAVCLGLICVSTLPGQVQAQEVTTAAPAAVHTLEKSDTLHSTVVAAAIKAHKEGNITRFQLMKIRVAMLSPAFRAKVEQLAVIQITASQEEKIPFTFEPGGDLVTQSVDWAGLADFIERLLPLVLQLIQIFSGL